MNIGKNYKMESDNLNITLLQKKKITGTARGKKSTKEVGTEYWTPIAYFSNPHNALRYMAKNDLMEDGFKDMKSIVKKLDDIYSLVNSLKNLPEIPR